MIEERPLSASRSSSIETLDTPVSLEFGVILFVKTLISSLVSIPPHLRMDYRHVKPDATNSLLMRPHLKHEGPCSDCDWLF